MNGRHVTYVTEEDSVSAWAGKTSERWRIRSRLLERGVNILTAHAVTRFDGERALLECVYSGRTHHDEANAVVAVTQRNPNDQLYHQLVQSVDGEAQDLPFTLSRIGDCNAPAIIAAAVYAGYKYAIELDTIQDIDQPLTRDWVEGFANKG